MHFLKDFVKDPEKGFLTPVFQHSQVSIVTNSIKEIEIKLHENSEQNRQVEEFFSLSIPFFSFSEFSGSSPLIKAPSVLIYS